jgi:hypothetical protein
MDIFGVEVEQPRINLEPPLMGYAVISVNRALPIAVADGQTLEVKKGETIELIHIGANYDRGLSADVLGLGGFNDIRLPLVVNAPTTVVVQKDHLKIGRIKIGLLPADYAGTSPRLSGEAKVTAPRAGTPVMVADIKPADPQIKPAAKPEEKPAAKPETKPESKPAASPSAITFLLEVDGQPTEVAAGGELTVPAGASLKMVDIRGAKLPPKAVMNLRGFLPPAKTGYNNGEDRGTTADTGKDMLPKFSRGGQGLVYDLNAELGKDILATAAIKIMAPRLATVTFTAGGQTRTVTLGSRTGIPAGTPVTVEKIELAEGLKLTKPRFTLGGKDFSTNLPQTVTMPGFAANVAVFEDGQLAGKVLWFPSK